MQEKFNIVDQSHISTSDFPLHNSGIVVMKPVNQHSIEFIQFDTKKTLDNIWLDMLWEKARAAASSRGSRCDKCTRRWHRRHREHTERIEFIQSASHIGLRGMHTGSLRESNHATREKDAQIFDSVTPLFAVVQLTSSDFGNWFSKPLGLRHRTKLPSNVPTQAVRCKGSTYRKNLC
jgi:hypothetical protein